MQKKSVIIVSDHLAGFITAQVLHHQGFNVTLVDTDHETRTTDRFQRLGLPFYRNTSQFRHGVRELAEALGEVIDVREADLPPQTVVDHESRAFVGFGESRSPALQALSHYNHAERLLLSKYEGDIVKSLFSKIEFKCLPFAELSAVTLNGSTVENVIISGQQTLTADYYLFLTAQTPWLSMLPVEVLGSRSRTRLGKSHTWTRILIELTHASAARTEENIFILTPNQPDHNPCAGQFFMQSTDAGVVFKSAWETFISADRIEDAEYVASEIKQLRKLVKRAFPDLAESAPEMLSITPHAYSDLHWVYSQKDMHEMAKNLLVYPALAADSVGFAQSVECASWALDGIHAKLTERRPSSPPPDEHAPTLLS
jgi:hypothetical protein